MLTRSKIFAVKTGQPRIFKLEITEETIVGSYPPIKSEGTLNYYKGKRHQSYYKNISNHLPFFSAWPVSDRVFEFHYHQPACFLLLPGTKRKK